MRVTVRVVWFFFLVRESKRGPRRITGGVVRWVRLRFRGRGGACGRMTGVDRKPKEGKFRRRTRRWRAAAVEPSDGKTQKTQKKHKHFVINRQALPVKMGPRQKTKPARRSGLGEGGGGGRRDSY